MQDYKKLEIWKKGIIIVDTVYQLTKTFPKNEEYGLSAQMKKAAVSIPANIAEGSAKRSMKDFGRFLDISLGSIFELETHLIIANRNLNVNEEVLNQLQIMIEEEKKMIYAFLQKVLKPKTYN